MVVDQQQLDSMAQQQGISGPPPSIGFVHPTQQQQQQPPPQQQQQQTGGGPTTPLPPPTVHSQPPPMVHPNIVPIRTPRYRHVDNRSKSALLLLPPAAFSNSARIRRLCEETWCRREEEGNKQLRSCPFSRRDRSVVAKSCAKPLPKKGRVRFGEAKRFSRSCEIEIGLPWSKCDSN